MLFNFSTAVLLGNLWQVKTVDFLYRCLIRALLLLVLRVCVESFKLECGDYLPMLSFVSSLSFSVAVHSLTHSFKQGGQIGLFLDNSATFVIFKRPNTVTFWPTLG